jgi:hypothetical protein
MLSPQALVPKVSIIMPDWLTALLALLRPMAASPPVNLGLPGGVMAFSRAAAKCHSGWILLFEGEGRSAAGDKSGELGCEWIGEPVGVV